MFFFKNPTLANYEKNFYDLNIKGITGEIINFNDVIDINNPVITNDLSDNYMVVAEGIQTRLKYLVVESLLGQDVSYFEEEDKPEQSPGAISALISEKAWQISMLTGFQLATNINGISGLLGGIILGLFFAWKLALVITCCILTIV